MAIMMKKVTVFLLAFLSFSMACNAKISVNRNFSPAARVITNRQISPASLGGGLQLNKSVAGKIPDRFVETL
jgi:hypothetical protein